MGYDEFFTDGDKPYAENLNDSLLLMDAFDVTVPCEMPDMFSNGQFSSTVDVSRKCGVSIVTLKSVASGITIGTDSISGSGDITFRVYPNFNSFYKWSKIILEKSGTVSIAFKKADGTSITASVGNDGTISETSALKELAPVDVVLTLTSAMITNILIEFVNNQADHTRVNALLEADQLVNIDGEIASGNDKVVTGGTIYTAVNAKENLSNKVTTLDSSDTHYPSSKAVKTVTDSKEDSSNKKTSLSNSDTYYPTCKAVKSVTDTKENASNKVDNFDNNSSHYPSNKAMNHIVEMLKCIIDAELQISTSTGSGFIQFNLTPTFQYLPEMYMCIWKKNKTTSEITLAEGINHIYSSESQTWLRTSDLDTHNFYFTLHFKGSQGVVLCTSPTYDKNGNVVS